MKETCYLDAIVSSPVVKKWIGGRQSNVASNVYVYHSGQSGYLETLSI